jgi:hypothetical protein
MSLGCSTTNKKRRWVSDDDGDEAGNKIEGVVAILPPELWNVIVEYTGEIRLGFLNGGGDDQEFRLRQTKVYLIMVHTTTERRGTVSTTDDVLGIVPTFDEACRFVVYRWLIYLFANELLDDNHTQQAGECELLDFLHKCAKTHSILHTVLHSDFSYSDYNTIEEQSRPLLLFCQTTPLQIIQQLFDLLEITKQRIEGVWFTITPQIIGAIDQNFNYFMCRMWNGDNSMPKPFL